MTRLFLASIVVGALAVVPCAVEAQKPTPKKDALPKSNQVYVKIILPTEPAKNAKDRPVVESWIAEELKKRGQTKFTAATAWVPVLALVREIWDGTLDDKVWECALDGKIIERADGRIKVRIYGQVIVIVSLTDEPGSREIAAVGELKTKQGRFYVAVLIGPPPEEPAASTDNEK